MLRLIAGVIVGYLVMAVFIFATFSIAFIAMGPDGAYQPGTFEISILWIATSFALGLCGAIAGGYVCAAIGRNPRAVPALANPLAAVAGILIGGRLRKQG